MVVGIVVGVNVFLSGGGVGEVGIFCWGFFCVCGYILLCVMGGIGVGCVIWVGC